MKPGESRQLPGAPHCPQCHKQIDGVTNFEEEDAEPEPGRTITVCCYCAAVLMYDKRRRFRSMTPAERAMLSPDELKALERARWAVAEALRLVRTGGVS